MMPSTAGPGGFLVISSQETSPIANRVLVMRYTRPNLVHMINRLTKLIEKRYGWAILSLPNHDVIVHRTRQVKRSLIRCSINERQMPVGNSPIPRERSETIAITSSISILTIGHDFKPPSHFEPFTPPHEPRLTKNRSPAKHSYGCS